MNAIASPSTVQEDSEELLTFFKGHPGELISMSEILKTCGISEDAPSNKKNNVIAKCKRELNSKDREVVSIIREWYAFCRKDEIEKLQVQAREKNSQGEVKNQVRKILQKGVNIPTDIRGLHEKIPSASTVTEVRQVVSELVEEEKGFVFNEDKDAIVWHDLEMSAEIEKDFSIEGSVVSYKGREIENLVPQMVSIFTQLLKVPTHTTSEGSNAIAKTINTRLQEQNIPFEFRWKQLSKRGRFLKVGKAKATATKSSNHEKTPETLTLSEEIESQKINYKKEVLKIDINGSKKQIQGLSIEEAKILTYYLGNKSEKISIISIYEGEYSGGIHAQATQLLVNINTVLRDYGLEKHLIKL